MITPAFNITATERILPRMELDFTTGVLDPRVTFTRGSNATLVDSTGKITYAPSNLLLNSVFGGAVSGTPGTAPTNWGFFIANGTLTVSDLGRSYAANALRVAATANRQVMSQTVTLAAASKYIISMNVNVFTAVQLQQMLQFNPLPAAATVQYVYNGVNQAGSFVPSTGVGILQATITTAATAGSLGIRIGIGTSSNSTGDVLFWDIQAEQVTYQTTRSAYNPTTTAAYYGPRFDYDPVTLQPKGLLIEEQRTNLFLQSETFDNAGWFKSACSISANSTLSPSGVVNADKLVEGTSNGTHIALQAATATTGPNTFSVYLKAAERTWARIYVDANVGNSAYFNLANGTVGTINGATTATIQSVGNGWYRCSVSSSTSTSPQAWILPATGNGVDSYLGDGTSGIFIWGAQFEAGAFATSYIPTVASQVTRLADAATMTGTNFSSWYNASEGAFVADFDKYSTTSRGGVLCAGNTATATTATGITLDGQNDGKVRAYIENAGALQLGDLTLANYTANTPIKGAVAYAANNAVGAAASALGTVSTSVVVPTVDHLQIGAIRNTTSAAVLPLNGHIRSISYYIIRVLNAELQAFSK